MGPGRQPTSQNGELALLSDWLLVFCPVFGTMNLEIKFKQAFL